MFIEGYQFLNATVFAMETKQDQDLCMVLQYTQKGRPDNTNPVL